MRNETVLGTVDKVGSDVTVLTHTGTPIVSGKGDMDLLCGGCRTILVHGETASDVALQYKVLHLAVKCQCGAYNALSPKHGILGETATPPNRTP
jgi:hypothetical protein